MALLFSLFLLALAIAGGLWGYNKFLKPCNC
jgi:hypothetical protein